MTQMTDNQSKKNQLKLIKLKEVIKKTGLKNETMLAKAIKISSGYMSEIMTGKKNVPKTMGQKLEDELSISRKWFDFDEGGMLLTSKAAEMPEEDSSIADDLVSQLKERLKDKDEIISQKNEMIYMLREQLEEMRARLAIHEDKSKTGTS